MIQLEETHIRELIYHPFKMDGEETNLNDSIYTYQDPGELETLKKIFLKPFLTNVNTFEFTHAIDVKLNVLFELASSIHKDDDFISTSKQIARHLQSVSKHPNIKEGDLFIMKFDHIGLHDESYQGLGIYKIENKENFIETNSLSTENAGLQFKKGIGTKRLDKACLIVFTEEPYTLFVIDNAPIETDYWQNEFIKLSMKNDYVNHTNQFLTLAKTFVTDQIPKDFEVSKADQIDYLNAHGTSTPLGDINETHAIKAALGDHAKKTVLSSTKSMTGHLLGGAGGIESVFTVLALHHQKVPPTINLHNQDPECDLDYCANTARDLKMEYALKNNFGFGGTNGSLVFRRV